MAAWTKLRLCKPLGISFIIYFWESQIKWWESYDWNNHYLLLQETLRFERYFEVGLSIFQTSWVINNHAPIAIFFLFFFSECKILSKECKCVHSRWNMTLTSFERMMFACLSIDRAAFKPAHLVQHGQKWWSNSPELLHFRLKTHI